MRPISSCDHNEVQNSPGKFLRSPRPRHSATYFVVERAKPRSKRVSDPKTAHTIDSTPKRSGPKPLMINGIATKATIRGKICPSRLRPQFLVRSFPLILVV